MPKPRSLWNRVGLAAVIATAAAGAAFASNTITVPNGVVNGANPCGVGNHNSPRFSQDCGARVTFDGSTNDAFVQDNSPAAEGEYRVRFYVNLRGTTTTGAGFDNFAAFSGSEPVPPAAPAANSSRLRLVVTPAANAEENVHLTAREDDTTETSTADVLLKHGWHEIEARWKKATTSSSDDGIVEWWVDGAAKTGLSGLDNNTGGIDYVRWGAIDIASAPTGTLDMD
jgi:hypothetical protein